MKKEASTNIDRDLENFLMDNLYHEVSFSDIIRLDSYKKWAKDKWGGREDETRIQSQYMTIGYPAPSDEILTQFLWELGMCDSQSPDVQENTHRNMEGNVVNCTRWVGLQRTDKEWEDFKRKYGV